MTYRIESMSPIQLIGKEQRQFIGNVQANLFWETCQQEGTLAQLSAHSTSLDKELIGIADSTSYDGESYRYSIATPFDKKDAPAAFTLITLPASLWIKFQRSDFVSGSEDQELWTAIYAEIFSTAEYEPADYQLEVYPFGDGSYPQEISEIWISVKGKG